MRISPPKSATSKRPRTEVDTTSLNQTTGTEVNETLNQTTGTKVNTALNQTTGTTANTKPRNQKKFQEKIEELHLQLIPKTTNLQLPNFRIRNLQLLNRKELKNHLTQQTGLIKNCNLFKSILAIKSIANVLVEYFEFEHKPYSAIIVIQIFNQHGYIESNSKIVDKLLEIGLNQYNEIFLALPEYLLICLSIIRPQKYFELKCLPKILNRLNETIEKSSQINLLSQNLSLFIKLFSFLTQIYEKLNKHDTYNQQRSNFEKTFSNLYEHFNNPSIRNETLNLITHNDQYEIFFAVPNLDPKFKFDLMCKFIDKITIELIEKSLEILCTFQHILYYDPIAGLNKIFAIWNQLDLIKQTNPDQYINCKIIINEIIQAIVNNYTYSPDSVNALDNFWKLFNFCIQSNSILRIWQPQLVFSLIKLIYDKRIGLPFSVIMKDDIHIAYNLNSYKEFNLDDFKIFLVELINLCLTNIPDNQLKEPKLAIDILIKHAIMHISFDRTNFNGYLDNIFTACIRTTYSGNYGINQSRQLKSLYGGVYLIEQLYLHSGYLQHITLPKLSEKINKLIFYWSQTNTYYDLVNDIKQLSNLLNLTVEMNNISSTSLITHIVGIINNIAKYIQPNPQKQASVEICNASIDLITSFFYSGVTELFYLLNKGEIIDFIFECFKIDNPNLDTQIEKLIRYIYGSYFKLNPSNLNLLKEFFDTLFARFFTNPQLTSKLVTVAKNNLNSHQIPQYQYNMIEQYLTQKQPYS